MMSKTLATSFPAAIRLAALALVLLQLAACGPTPPGRSPSSMLPDGNWDFCEPPGSRADYSCSG